MDEQLTEKFFDILHEELVPALGCTEPIAIALASAKARDVLGKIPEHIVAKCSGNLIKNVKCVIVPNTENLVGIEASAIVGAVGGDFSKGMEVLSSVTHEQLETAKKLFAAHICDVELLDTPLNLHLIIRAEAGYDCVEVEIRNLHDNITSITKNGKSVSHAGVHYQRFPKNIL